MARRRPWLVLLGCLLAPVGARAGDTPFIGELMLTGYNFCPKGWAPANGQLLSIAQNTALFSLLGTYFGGNGQTTFGLPDLRGRTPIGVGQGPGLSDRAVGEQGGVETVTLTTDQMPAHTHAAYGSTLVGNTPNPAASLPARKVRTLLYRGGSPANTTLAADAIGPTGGGQPHENMPPYLAMTWCIAIQGIYPTRP
jgi:microcystin-dependent protein